MGTPSRPERDLAGVPRLALSAAEAAYALGGIGQETVYDLCLRREIAAVRIGTRWLIRPEALAAYLEANEIPARVTRPRWGKEVGNGSETPVPSRRRRA